MITKLLIANRGEIACRIVRTARRMGVATVAVHSDADATALHVREADEAVRIGGPAPAESYLNAVAVIEAALKSGADAVHPGYGFLSENADFAEACLAAGLVFVGPPPGAIRAMGDKARAKAIATEAGVPVVPGYDGADQSLARLAAEADRIGYPLLLKAAAGGGGRGMRQVGSAEEFATAAESAQREAEAAFGDGRLLIERLVTDARHIEIQVFGDSHGNIVHLGERDCSAQRRHQKVVEEAPSPFVDEALRRAMGADAVRAARAVGYVGAGTVEFIVAQDGGYHFLEMNTRLQVEHPVTELVTGFDLVEWQLRVAAGEPLPAAQDEIRIGGHAIEARLYAEDPYAGFRPQTGTVLYWKPEDAARDGVRIDNGVAEGCAVTPFYDPMVAKVVAHGRDRAEAIARLTAALRAAPLFGLATNRSFLIDLLASPEFVTGNVTTSLIDGWVAGGDAMLAEPRPTAEQFALAGAGLAFADGGDWFRSTGVASCPITLTCGETKRNIAIEVERGRLRRVLVDGEAMELGHVAVELPSVRFTAGGVVRGATALRDGRALWLDIEGRTFRFAEPDFLAGRSSAPDPSRITSPVAGLLRAVEVSVGDNVEPGGRIAVVEAMKMETALAARLAGTVRAVHAVPGDQVRAGQLIAEIDIA